MITLSLIDSFAGGVRGQALREGTRYAREARVCGFGGTLESVSAVVRGSSGEYEVALWSETGELQHRCNCPSWRDPCKHEVAAALVLRQILTQAAVDRENGGVDDDAARVVSLAGDGSEGPLLPALLAEPDPERARRSALEARVAAARREKLVVKTAEPPFMTVESSSGFIYRVHLRGETSGPHSCDCPDFEANRLHTCKHVERIRTYMRSPAYRRLSDHREQASRPRVYLHLGEVVEPRLFGAPKGRGAPAVRETFDPHGVPFPPMARDYEEMAGWLAALDRWVEPEALAWLDQRIRRRPVLPAGAIEDLRTPDSLTPYPYQWKGAEFLARRGRALLADEMGLGKTVQAILAALALRGAKQPIRCVTVVCPASLRGGWQDEIRRWAGERAALLEGLPRQRARVIETRPPWLVTHYEQVWRDFSHHAAQPPDLLVIDEAQRAKGLATRTARVLKAIAAPCVFALTGTPLENRLEEAYAIAQLIDQRLLPPLWQLDRDHFVRDGKGRRVVFYRNLGELRSRLAPAFLRRRKEDVALELPERIRSTSMVDLHPAVLDTYDDVMAQVARIARKKVILPADLDRMHRLLVIARRCCNGPHMLGLDVDDRKVPKLQELEETLRDLCLGEGRKAVVFSEWTDMTERVEALCGRLDLPAFHLRGSVPVKRRPALIRGFTERQGPAVFISTDAGGLGLNLQVADLVVNLDLPWNPARLEQRVARVHRIGSQNTVQILLLVAKGSIEHRILELHETKRNVLENVWSDTGEDTIAAPGGSGAFKQMLEALLRTQGPETEADIAPEAPEAENEGAAASPQAAPAPGAAASSSGRPPVIVPEPGPDDEDDAAAQPAEAHLSSTEETPPAPETPGVVDPEALAQAVAAVAPVLPKDHRRSLALVFRTLADVLEEDRA